MLSRLIHQVSVRREETDSRNRAERSRRPLHRREISTPARRERVNRRRTGRCTTTVDEDSCEHTGRVGTRGRDRCDRPCRETTHLLEKQTDSTLRSPVA